MIKCIKCNGKCFYEEYENWEGRCGYLICMKCGDVDFGNGASMNRILNELHLKREEIDDHGNYHTEGIE